MKCPRTGIPATFCTCSLHASARRPIGGQLTSQAYAALAQRHRPHYAAEIAAAVRELAKQGLRPYDISVSLGIGIDAVTALLESRPIAPGAASRSAPLAADESAAIHHSAWTTQRAGDAGNGESQ